MVEKTKTITLRNYSLEKPSDVVSMANVLKKHIVSNNLYTVIANKNYVHVDGWQFAGFLCGLNAMVDKVKNLSNEKETKWSAIAKIYSGEKLVSTGFAMCSNNETRKRTFDEYAILSMAQTRAIGKAFRNKIGWVMKLAGYESTPSEEMAPIGSQNENKKSSVAAVTDDKAKPPVDYLSQLKDRLYKLGAKNETAALAIIKKKTGLTWKSFRYVTQKQAQIALTNLLNSK